MFRNSAGLLLRGTLLYRWSESPFSSPQHSQHAHNSHKGQQHSTPHSPSPINTVPPFPFSIASTPSSSPPSATSHANSATLSPSTPSALATALADLKIDTPLLSRATSRNTSPVGSPQHAVRYTSGRLSVTASPTSTYHQVGGGSSPPSPSFSSALTSPQSTTAQPFPPPTAPQPPQPHSASLSLSSSAPRVVIVCHGMAVHSQWGFIPELCDSMLKEVSGLSAVLRFDFTGCGQSEGEFEFGGYSKQMDDIGAAVAAMRVRGYAVHALIGHSMGGNCVLLYASSHFDVPNIVNINGRYQMTRGLPFGPDQLTSLQQQGWFIWKPRGATLDTVKVTQETINERLSLDMDCVRRIASKDEYGQYRVRVLTVHGNDDAVVPVQDAHHYAELISNHTLRTLDDCDHNYSTQQAKLMLVTTVCEWMLREAASDKRLGAGAINGADSVHFSPIRSTTLPPPHPNPIHSTPPHNNTVTSAVLPTSASFSSTISPTTSSPLSTSPSSSHTLAKGLLSHRRSPSL